MLVSPLRRLEAPCKTVKWFIMKYLIQALFFFNILYFSAFASAEPRGSGDLGVVIEREKGSVQIVNTSKNSSLSRIEGLGDLSHASVVFSHDQRYAYVFGRDGGLSKIDLLQDKLEKRIIQAGNSIGGAISQDGRWIAVSNYTPGGVKIFSAQTLEQVADIPAVYGEGQLSKVVGLVDAPGERFVFCLFDAGEIWLADIKNPHEPKIQKFKNIGKEPYDASADPGWALLSGRAIRRKRLGQTGFVAAASRRRAGAAGLRQTG